jgi:hypothetical protein
MDIQKTMACLLVALPLAGSAQLGMDADYCKRIWGSPQGELSADGAGSLAYSAADTSVELGFERGLVVGATYGKPGLDKRDSEALLELNGNSHDWHVWTQPGVPGNLSQPRMWMRQGEMAMAELDGDTFRFFGSLALPESEPAAVQAAAAGGAQGADARQEDAAPTAVDVVDKVPVVRPDILPEPGDSRAAVLSLLGDPSGTMESDGKEILVYGWGSVWIAADKVVSVD